MTSTTISSATPIDPRTGWVLLHKDEQEIYVWAVHASGWQSLGWSLGPAPIQAPEPTPEPPMEPEEPDPEEPEEPGPKEPAPEEPADPAPEDPGAGVTLLAGQELPRESTPESTLADLLPGAPESSEAPDAATTIGADLHDADAVMPDFAAMTKAEIIEHCSRNHGVLLDSSLTKSALISEAEALSAAAPQPAGLMDDLMT